MGDIRRLKFNATNSERAQLLILPLCVLGALCTSVVKTLY